MAQKQQKQRSGRPGSGSQSGTGSKGGRSKGGTTTSGVKGGDRERANGGSAGRGGSVARRSPASGSPAGRGGRPGSPDLPGRSRAAALAHDEGLKPARPTAPRWLQLTTLVLSLLGLAVSIYLTIAHFTTAAVLACPANSFINCGEVTTSAESMVFGVFPVAVLGLAFYVFMVAINTPWAWRAQLPAIRWARVGSVVVGIGFVLYLVYAELIEIGKLCEYCTAVHVITFVLFVLIIFNATAPGGAAGGRASARR